MPAKKIVDIPETATPVGPGGPTPVVTAHGSTFAERKAARLKAIQSAENKAVQKS